MTLNCNCNAGFSPESLKSLVYPSVAIISRDIFIVSHVFGQLDLFKNI